MAKSTYTAKHYRRWRASKRRRASAVRRELIHLLGGQCAKCPKRYIAVLQIDHVDGCTWNQRSLNRNDRQFKYMKEYRSGVRLRILCSGCNKVHLPNGASTHMEPTKPLSENLELALTQEALANVPPVTVIPQDRIQELNIDHPGHIKYASQKDGGKYVGCLLRGFGSTAEVNDFFRENSNLVVIEMWPMADGYDVLYTNQLEREEMELYLELQDAYSKVKENLFRDREVKRREEEAKMDNEEKELKRYVTLGQKCENNHGKLEKMAERIAELEAQLKLIQKNDDAENA